MSNNQNAIETKCFWDKLVSKTNVDLPDLPDRYKSDNGDFLIGMAKEQGRRLVSKSGVAIPEKWVTGETIDGAIFAYPDVDTCFDLSSPMNYGSAERIDAKAFGLICTLTVYSHGSFEFEHSNPVLSGIMGNGYHELRDSFYSLLDVALYPDDMAEDGDDKQISQLSWFADITDAQKEALSNMSSGIYSITNQ